MTRELALVCGDGAIKGGFIAGAITSFFEHFPDQLANLKTIVATSASVGSMFYLLSHGLNHPGRKIWIEDLSSKRFISYESWISDFRGRPIYDIDYMTDVIFREHNPLDLEAIRQSPIEFYFPVQNYETNEVEFFSNSEDYEFVRGSKVVKVRHIGTRDIYSLIKAASAAPFVYDKCVEIDGRPYVDAATLEPFTLDIPALRGKKKIVMVTKSNFSLSRNMSYHLMGALWPLLVSPFKREKFKPAIYHQYMRKPAIMRKLQEEAMLMQSLDDLIYIKPIEKLGSNTDNSRASLERNFRHGESVVSMRREEIEEFLAR